MWIRYLTLSALVLLTACGSGDSSGPVPGDEPFEGRAMIIQPPGERATMCTGPVAESDPPQCSGVPITNWDWDAVEGEQEAGGTRYGEYRVSGVIEGGTFTVTNDPEPIGY
ncbi:MAG TPA: hypothetical protein VEA19_01225 [Actinomycetota bacterium]|nr:hypothetical protein [Actinomycetota bacterium]